MASYSSISIQRTSAVLYSRRFLECLERGRSARPQGSSFPLTLHLSPPEVRRSKRDRDLLAKLVIEVDGFRRSTLSSFTCVRCASPLSAGVPTPKRGPSLDVGDALR